MQKYLHRNLPGRLYVAEYLIFTIIFWTVSAIIFPFIKHIRDYHEVDTAHRLLAGTSLSWLMTGVWIYLASKLPDSFKSGTMMQLLACLLMFFVAVTVIPFIFLGMLALRWYIHPGH